jgi:hypothetical protein
MVSHSLSHIIVVVSFAVSHYRLPLLRIVRSYCESTLIAVVKQLLPIRIDRFVQR